MFLDSGRDLVIRGIQEPKLCLHVLDEPRGFPYQNSHQQASFPETFMSPQGKV